MTEWTADEALVARLRGIVKPVEIRDESGKVLGHYTPVLSTEEERMYAEAAKLFDFEELERRIATKEKGYSIEEVLERLRSLEPPK